MNPDQLSDIARKKIHSQSRWIDYHLDVLTKMVAIDSRSFSVNEYPGDRTEPSDMQDILKLASDYLAKIGFQNIRVNEPRLTEATPILLAEWIADKNLPTILMYAHLDKQPYMDDERFLKWEGHSPTTLRWNHDKTRAYGRGAADDLSGVVAIGMAASAVIETLNESGVDNKPCNLKVIFETEEECGSQTLSDQIAQNRDFFGDVDTVIITDVINPDTGIPGLTTTLRGVLQSQVTLRATKETRERMDAQTALYKLMASLIDDQHNLQVKKIVHSDTPVTDAEKQAYTHIPIEVEAMRDQAGVHSETRLTVNEDKVSILLGQLRNSYVNVRPGHRVSGGVVLGTSAVRIHFHANDNFYPSAFEEMVKSQLQGLNNFNLRLTLEMTLSDAGFKHFFDLTLSSSSKDPHSGVIGGPFPVPELQLAKMIDRLIDQDGHFVMPSLREQLNDIPLRLESLHTGEKDNFVPFDKPEASSLVEIRLAPGNTAVSAVGHLKEFLLSRLPEGFDISVEDDKGGDPWMTGIDHTAFSIMLDSLEKGFGRKASLYGCGGSIPFVSKLVDALGDITPLCIGAYDPECKMHEPNESLSMVDLLGCARSIVDFVFHAKDATIVKKNT